MNYCFRSVQDYFVWFSVTFPLRSKFEHMKIFLRNYRRHAGECMCKQLMNEFVMRCVKF